MKVRFTLLLFFTFISYYSFSQCVGNNRYKSNIFSYDSIINVKYGSNVTALSSTPLDLALDIYLPSNDTMMKRPVIFFTHGGSFLSGTKADGDVVYLCREFAKKGYVCVSQDYRIGMENFDATSASRAVWRAMQDARAAVRFMKANAITYKIDTNMIIYGGSSAGGFTALHLAFLDKPSEVLSSIDTSEYTGIGSTGLGNFKGTTNNLPNTSNIHAIINLCGAIGDTAWIEDSDRNIPVISMHGTIDRTVPYGTAVIKLLNIIPLLEVNGSASIRKKLNQENHPNYFFTYCGEDHVPYAGLTVKQRAWMDTTVNFITKHLYEDVLKCGASGVYSNQVDSADCPISSIENISKTEIKLFPNPSNAEFNLSSEDVIEQIQIFDASYKLVEHFYVNSSDYTFDFSKYPQGLYILKADVAGKIYHQKLIKN